MFTQFSEISARFIQVDKSKGVKRLLFSPQYIEHKISIFNEIFNRMKEQKNLSYSLRKVDTSLQKQLKLNVFADFEPTWGFYRLNKC